MNFRNFKFGIGGRYAKFWNMTFLYDDWDANQFIPYEDSEEYFDTVRQYLREDTEEDFHDGDILFIGSTYETRQYYGFATVINNGTDFEGGEYPSMYTPGVYYQEAVEEINEFWRGFEGDDYFDDDWIQRLKDRGVYSLPTAKEKWKSLLPMVRAMSETRRQNEEVLGEYFPSGVADKISRLSVFGRSSKLRSVNSDIFYLKSIKFKIK
jgi:hypothetical protein